MIKSNKYWFKTKLYGAGFCPISWEGWLATAILLGAVFLSAHLRGITNEEVLTKEGFGFLFDLIVLLTTATFIFKSKTKGKLGWRWGK